MRQGTLLGLPCHSHTGADAQPQRITIAMERDLVSEREGAVERKAAGRFRLGKRAFAGGQAISEKNV